MLSAPGQDRFQHQVRFEFMLPSDLRTNPVYGDGHHMIVIAAILHKQQRKLQGTLEA